MTTTFQQSLAGSERVLFVGSYGVGNLGDEAILSVLLRDVPPDANVTVLTRSPEEGAELHGVRCVQAVSPRAFAEVLRADVVVLGGGGIFTGLGGRLTRGLAEFLRFAQLAGKTVVVEGIGVYPDTAPGTLRRALKVLRRARRVSVRDATSFELLRRHGVPCERVPDVAFRLEPAPADVARQILAAEGVPLDGRLIGVSPRRVRDPVQQERIARALPAALRRLQADGHDVVFLPTAHFRFGTFTNDLHFSEEIARELDPDRTFVVRGLHHPRVACALFGVPRAHVTMRLHAMIFARRMARPCVPISYADKVADVAKELDVDAVPVDALTGDALADAVTAALREPAVNDRP